MKNIVLFLAIFINSSLVAQIYNLNEQNLENINVTSEKVVYKQKEAIKVLPNDTKAEAKFVKIGDLTFSNGIIEIEVVGKRAESAGEMARGFVGIAFRINDDNSKFECFYIRPTNGRANDQLRRNHSVQYISFPEFPWFKLRKETPGKYETYSDLVEGEWTKLKIEVTNDKAKLYVGGVEQPTLLVNDLKLGSDGKGAIGLWVGPGTEAYFSGLEIKDL